MKSLAHHIKHPHHLFDHFHDHVHHAFVVIILAMIGMLRGAAHIIPLTTSAGYVVGGFLTPEFWTQSPTNDNITYALFGDGSPGSTPYTRIWDDSCIPTSVSLLSNTFAGGTLSANTIYILNSGNYTLTSPITMSGCSALVGNGDVVIYGNGNSLSANNRENIIIDNLIFRGNGLQTGFNFDRSLNITINNSDIYDHDKGIYIISGYLLINNSKIYNNTYGIYGLSGININIQTINNSMIYNNTYGIYIGVSIINNSQIYNNTEGLHAIASFLNNVIFYNNTQGVTSTMSAFLMNNVYFYNNDTGLNSPYTDNTYFGILKFFGNNTNLGLGTILSGGTTPPIDGRSNGMIETGSETMDYNRVANPQNASGSYLLNGSTRSSLRDILFFDSTKRPLRYIFGGDILKQDLPIWFDGINFTSYGTDGIDYDTTNYIAEPESRLSPEEQTIVETYFGEDSIYTEQREDNRCSLSAFRTVYLMPGTFNSTTNVLEDHTLYILTGGEYKSTASTDNAFVLGGDCIALIGNGNTKMTKQNANVKNILYTNGRHNIIIDNIAIDGKYYNYPTSSTGLLINPGSSGPSSYGIKLNSTSNDITIAHTQVFNTRHYGIALGQGSHHITITDSQIANNLSGAISLSYSSNYNIINNVLAYNNGTYGIWLANGSHRNTINNSQIYNNGIGIFFDQTTQNNIINNSAIYNNNVAGISLKNSSNNILNDVMVFNNTKGIQTIYNSVNNVFYGTLHLFDNISSFDGTTANDGRFAPGDGGIFSYAGTLTTGNNIMGCSYVTNPSVTNSATPLLSNSCNFSGRNAAFVIYIPSMNYMYGLDVYQQRTPVAYQSGSDDLIELSSSRYDTSKYIAENSAVRDDDPENVLFGDTSAIELNTGYTTSVYTAGFINTPVTISLVFSPSTTGTLIVNGSNIGSSGTIRNGDAIQIQLFTPATYTTTITGTLTLGSVTNTIAFTTRSRSQLPSTGSLAFASFTSVPVSTFTGDNTTIIGIETGVSASITFVPATTSGRLEIYSGTTMIASGTSGLTVYSGNIVRALAQSSSGYAQTVTGYITIGAGTGVFTLTTKGADSIPPSTPLLTYPLSGEQIFFVVFQWNASVDTGSGIQGYVYEIAEDSEFSDIIDDGFISTTTGTAGSPDSDFDVTSDAYYVRIRAQDRDDNLSPWSNIGYFKIKDLDEWNFTPKTNANLRTLYDSDEISLNGVKPNLSVWASVDENGILYKNGVEKGSGAYVQNDDELFVAIRSSSRYDKTISSTLTIANRTLEFTVTTKKENDTCDISSGDVESIEIIFDSLITNYSGSEDRYDEFLSTMQSMLADEIDFTDDCNLHYLQDLIGEALGQQIGSGTISGTGTHIAPNCKAYPIQYDSTRKGYTSSGFTMAVYFANLDTLGRYIDSKNPGDCHITTYGPASWIFSNTDASRHIASNGKIYLIQSESQGFTSSDLSIKKYFSTLAGLRNYIDSKNPPQAVRSHQVDTSFTPQTYTAPNGKSYILYRTNRGYMSYKLLTVRYFSSLSEIQTYISRNNPK